MPKFKYVPKKENLPIEPIENKDEIQEVQKEEPKIQTEIKSSIIPTPYRMNPIVQPKPFPKKEDEIKVEQPKPEVPTKTEPLKPIEQPIQRVQEKPIDIEIPDFVKPVEIIQDFSKEDEELIKDDFDLDFLTEKSEQKKKEKKTFKLSETDLTKYKPSKKVILLVGVVMLAIIMVIGVCNLSSGQEYTITTQDVIATSVQNIEEGALIDIKNSVPLNLSIRDFNISLEDKGEENITFTIWDFTDTNRNKVAIYVNGEIKEKGFELTKEPKKITVPKDAKVEIMQVETVNSPYTPYALQINGTTYFNRMSSEKLNTYQFLVMKEIKNLDIDDFKPEEPTE